MIQDHYQGVKIDYQPKEKRYEFNNEHIPILKYIETLGAWEHSSLKFSQEIGEWMTMAKGHKLATYKLLQNISLLETHIHCIYTRNTAKTQII